MTEARTKSAPFGLSQTAISYLEEWAKEHLYGYPKEFSTKYTRKGLKVESEAIEFASKMLDWGMVFKNEQSKENGYITGTCDVILSDQIADTKCSWDQFTFPLFDEELPEKGYDWQLQGYMWLYDKPRGQVVYALMNAPVEEIEREALYKSREAGYDELDFDLFEKVRASRSYDHHPDHLRIKTFQIERDENKINAIKVRVEQCRAYIADRIVPRISNNQKQLIADGNTSKHFN